jgi:hypothetical protein
VGLSHGCAVVGAFVGAHRGRLGEFEGNAPGRDADQVEAEPPFCGQVIYSPSELALARVLMARNNVAISRRLEIVSAE